MMTETQELILNIFMFCIGLAIPYLVFGDVDDD